MPIPPIAPKRPHAIHQHGEVRVDDYFWLRNQDDPEVTRYLAAENGYTEAVMTGTLDLQARLYAEMRGRIPEDDTSAPESRGELEYYQRSVAGKAYPIYCRKRGALGEEEVLLDVNKIAEGHDYCRLGVFEPSPDQRLIAYSVDHAGDEAYTLVILDLTTGALLPERIPNTYYAVEWANDGRTLLYNVLDDVKRPHQIFRHTCGTDPSEDVLIHHETDASCYAWVRKTKDRAYLLVHLFNMEMSEWWFAPAGEPAAAFRVVRAREPGIEYAVEHHAGRFLIVTNEGAKNFRLVSVPASDPDKASWRELIPHREDVFLQSIECFRDLVVRYEREGGLKRIRVSDPHFEETRELTFPDPVYTFVAGTNVEFDSSVLRINYSSLVTPSSALDFDLRTGECRVRKVDEIPSGYDATQYACERVSAPAPDGRSVPMSIVYKKGLVRDGRHPALMRGYGAYGFSAEPFFDPNRLSLLDRGFVFAIAHVRGGAELGRAWYEEGKLLNKRNSFTDFIACAEHLIARGYTSSERLAVMGVSAGGLLVGAATNLRPDLFRCVVAKVPFVDVVNSMNDPNIPLSVMEWDQWGNPADPVVFRYLMSYSPYDNTSAQAYPNLLVTAGLNDPRVPYWEPAKWTAKLRALKTDDNRLLLRTHLNAGHSGPSGRYELLEETAFEYAFMIDSVMSADREREPPFS